MRTRPLVLVSSLAVLSAAVAPTARAQRDGVTVISGTVLGADGAPMKLAHVHLSRAVGGGRIVRAQATAAGRFVVATTETGGLQLLFTGVDHYSTTVPLLITAPSAIVLDVRLKHHVYKPGLDSIRAIGDFNGFKADSGRALVRQPDGRYTLEIQTTGDTLAYQLVGHDTSGERTTGGTAAVRYAYVDNAGYRSVVSVRKGRASIAFDPGALQRPGGVSRVTFRDTTTRPARLYSIWRDRQELHQTWTDSSRAAKARHDSLRFNWGPAVARNTTALLRERDPIARQLLLLQFVDMLSEDARIDTALAWRILRDVPPSSPWWTFREDYMPELMLFAIRAGLGRRGRYHVGSPPDTAFDRLLLGYLDRVMAEHPDSTVRAAALVAAIDWANGARRDDYYRRFLQDYPNSPSGDYVNVRFAPNRLWRVGARVPAFRLASLDDTAVTYTPESLAGRPYLLDFWATWCGPCNEEMPFLHAAHDSLAADGVEFLSVSTDERAELVRTFRGDRWRMPWRHAIVAGGWSNPVLGQLEIPFIPRTFLIGSDGTILAADEELRGESLLPTIRRALRDARRP
jgi:thiol-disulfide isomerase/thioredoxin